MGCDPNTGAIAWAGEHLAGIRLFVSPQEPQGGHLDGEYAASAAEAVVRDGHAYVEMFGPGGDWGVASAEWGMAYLTLEWLAGRTLADWTIEAFETARVDANQDLIALRRRDP